MLNLTSPENKQQRVFAENSGRIWLHFKDLCTNLDFANTTQTAEQYGLTGWIKQMSNGTEGKPPMWIQEEGAYLLMFEARTTEAQNFKYWLATKVLPELRQNGSYSLKDGDREHFQAVGLSLGEEAEQTIRHLLGQMRLNGSDPLAVSRYGKAIEALNATLHRNPVVSDLSDQPETIPKSSGVLSVDRKTAIARFAQDELILTPDDRDTPLQQVEGLEVYEKYKRFAEANSLPVPGYQKFIALLKAIAPQNYKAAASQRINGKTAHVPSYWLLDFNPDF